MGKMIKVRARARTLQDTRATQFNHAALESHEAELTSSVEYLAKKILRSGYKILLKQQTTVDGLIHSVLDGSLGL